MAIDQNHLRNLELVQNHVDQSLRTTVLILVKEYIVPTMAHSLKSTMPSSVLCLMLCARWTCFFLMELLESA